MDRCTRMFTHSFRTSSARTARPMFSRCQTTLSEAKALNWAEYLALRGSRHKWQTAMTIPSCALGLFGGAAYFGSLDTDPMKPIWGIDPFIFYGACTAACMGVGYIVGPTLGSALWRIVYRRSARLVDARDREFYQRIAKNRVDASLQSPTSPVPDYYGERVGSLRQYRRWLRDQGKYKRKVLLPEE
ncbi:mitochondrial import protein Pam17 [Armillaria solidipes]|uniref:Presequence translocated-associated motor subunit PAM17 n=1 Tax=Armillaria solidipes TaxID=1076256 RepID=A0A2H3CU34_9AGAR|nr:mitochondrial import protein Pam17 [Armillaria solidipes]